MKKASLALAVAAGTLGLTLGNVANAAFIEDSTAKLDLRNFYFDQDNRESQGEVGVANAHSGQVREWGQAFQLNLQSGFTEGTVGVGVDAWACWAYVWTVAAVRAKLGRIVTRALCFPWKAMAALVTSSVAWA